jgi:hypothetical protein
MFQRTFGEMPPVIAETDSGHLLLSMVELSIGCTVLTAPTFTTYDTFIRWMKHHSPLSEHLHFQCLSHLFPKRPIFFVCEEKFPVTPPNADALIGRFQTMSV